MVAVELEVFGIKTSWETHENNDFQASSELINSYLLKIFTFTPPWAQLSADCYREVIMNTSILRELTHQPGLSWLWKTDWKGVRTGEPGHNPGQQASQTRVPSLSGRRWSVVCNSPWGVGMKPPVAPGP